jgi:hypothetical protein
MRKREFGGESFRVKLSCRLLRTWRGTAQDRAIELTDSGRRGRSLPDPALQDRRRGGGQTWACSGRQIDLIMDDNQSRQPRVTGDKL